MPVTKNMTVTSRVVSPACSVRTSATITIDVNSETLMSYSAPSCCLSGGVGVDPDYFRLVSYSTSSNMNTSTNLKSLTYHIDAEVRTSVDLDGLEVWTLRDISFNAVFYPFR